MTQPADSGGASAHALTIDPLATAVREARRHVARALEDLGRADLVDNAVLGVSELVTNATLHARTALTVIVRKTARGRVRIEVRDGSPAVPRQRMHSATATTGRGLVLLQAVSADWGVDPVQEGQGSGKIVWFEPDPEMHEVALGERLEEG